jgi:serine/threonine protein phosphatase PrpC
MAVQCYGASRPKDGSTANEDAFWIQRPGGTAAVVCDGAANAQRCAARVVDLFTRHLASGALEVQRFPAWASWLKTIDASLAGGSQTTFVGVALADDHVYGASCGDSRAYLVSETGTSILTDGATPRLGSGDASPQPIHVRLAARDVLVLMTDGAWTPLSASAIERCVRGHALKHPSDLPSALIDLAGARGRPDDMTVVILTRRPASP